MIPIDECNLLYLLKIAERHLSLILETGKPTSGTPDIIKALQDELTKAEIKWKL